MDQNYGSVKAQGDNLTLSKGIYLSIIFRNFHTHDTVLVSTKEKEAETRNRAWPKAYYIVGQKCWTGGKGLMKDFF